MDVQEMHSQMNQMRQEIARLQDENRFLREAAQDVVEAYDNGTLDGSTMRELEILAG